MLRSSAYLAQMLHNARLPVATLAARQTRRLCNVVRRAASRVPFYRELYAPRGANALAFGSLEDLPALPIVDKQILRTAGTSAVSLDAPTDCIRISTSGSTGEPFTFQIDRGYDQWRKAQYLRPYLNSGRRFTDKILRLMAFPVERSPWFSRLGMLRESQIDCAADATQLLRTWGALAPDVLQGYPSSLRSLAHDLLERGDCMSPAPRLVFTDSELLTPDTRSLIERAFGTSPIDIFGTYETDNIAFQCAARDGYHVATDCVVLEIVRDGLPVPLGEEGEIVATVLANHTQPFIRYNLKDVGRMSTAPCPCGLPFPLLSVIRGRAHDFIALADGRQRSVMPVLARLDPFTTVIRHYQLRQVELHRFEVLIVPGSRFAEVGVANILNALGSTLDGAALEVKLVEAIDQDPSGKRRSFISTFRPQHDS